MIALNYRDSRPIYEQVKEGFRKLILSGVLAPGVRLPSVRELAAELTINPNTIQRAYRELEAEGFTYSIPGKGSFAAGLDGISDTHRTEQLRAFTDAARELLQLGVTEEELGKKLHALSQEVSHD